MAADTKPNWTISGTNLIRTWLNRLGPFIGLLIVIVIFAFVIESPGRYLSITNLRVILAQTVVVAIGAIGMTIIIISGGIDLSVGSTIALCGVITALTVNSGSSATFALVVGVLLGGLVGVVNGLVITGFALYVLYFGLVVVSEVLLFRVGFKVIPLVVVAVVLLSLLRLFVLLIRRFTGRPLLRLKVVPFIATLGMLGVARGTAKWFASEQTVNVPPTWINQMLVTFPNPSWLLVSPGVWITISLAIVAALMLRQTVLGRRIFALGSNEAAARACGIATDRLKIYIYGLAGLLFGLAGVMQMSRLRQGDPTVAAGLELDIIAAVVIGGGSLNGGEGSILGAMIGALIMAFLRNGCQQVGWPNYIQEIIIGALIVIAVAVDRWRSSRMSAA
jgi:ribose transport system permease protein